MAVVYKVKPGDTLSAIGKAYGINWRDIAAANPNINPNTWTIYSGQSLNIPGATSGADAATNAFTATSKAVETAPKNFSDLVKWENFFPSAPVQQFAESQVNPEAARIAEKNLGQYDWTSALSNSFRSGFNQQGRTALQNELERGRKTDIENYVQKQKDIFTNLYGTEMNKYYDNPANYKPQYEEYLKAFMPTGIANTTT